GRFCYNNNQEISDYINKVQSYLNEPISNEMRTALFVGEYLWDGPTWGGDYMDEMIGGSSTNGHETVGIPADWNISTLYERDGNWEAPQIQAALSNGPNMVNHLGHSNSDYNMKLYTSQVSNSTISNDGNNHNFSIIYSQGCIAGAFEVSDCIAEKFVSISHAAVAMLANSRYGWGMQGSTDGASQFFHREYIDAIFEEDIFDIGYANNDSKIDAIPFMSGNNTVLFWVCYEMNLLGDPALSVWTDTPQDIVATHPANIILGSSEVEISTNVNSAHVAVLLDGEIIGTSNTNLTGNTIVYFDEPVQDTAELSIVVVKHNYNTYEGNITVIPGNGAYVVCNSPEFSESGDYLDGSIQSLDIVDMDVTLVNIGLENSGDNVGAILSTESNFVNIIDNTTETGQIEATGSIILENAFQVELLPGIPDGSYLPFTVEITSGDNTWQSEIFMQVQGPVLEFSNYEMNILDGDDQILDPGESLEIYLYYNNIGSGYSYNVSTTLFTYDPYAVVGGSDMIPQIDPGSQTITTQPFTIEISPSCPSEYSVQIELLAFDIVGSNLSTSFNIPVGLTNHDFEDGLGDWTHSSLSGGYVDQWHLSDNKNHTDNGEYSVKCGGTGSSDYANHTHSGLVTPDIVLLPDSYIKFYHWMDAEIDNSTQAWDGGLIEISTDGENFQGIEPLGGYPYTITPNDESPFPPGIPVFSGSINWQEVELDLSDFSGSVQLRFVFGSDGYVTGEGWYIDDLQVGSYTSSENDYVIPAKAILNQNYPNPFYAASNSRANTTISFSIPEDAFVNLDVFNIKGQLVKTLIDDQVNRGNHEVQWNGTDNSDRPVASGIYFYKLKPDGKFTSVKKMILMK
nr:T9SS type A sorting domain-containing protein [Candidatus Cloacimonadota bacterium]